MALGFTPAVQITGANAALINTHLVDWEHVDASGVKSDTLKLTVRIDDLEGMPSFEGKIGLLVGYHESGLVDKGEFNITLQRSMRWKVGSRRARKSSLKVPNVVPGRCFMPW